MVQRELERLKRQHAERQAARHAGLVAESAAHAHAGASRQAQGQFSTEELMRTLKVQCHSLSQLENVHGHARCRLFGMIPPLTRGQSTSYPDPICISGPASGVRTEQLQPAAPYPAYVTLDSQSQHVLLHA